MKKGLEYCFLLALLLLGTGVSSQAANDRKPKKEAGRDTLYTDIYLDTVNVSKVSLPNDYMMIGFEAGAGFNRMQFNPPYTQAWRFSPEYYELTFTKYCKMFGYMPYFGFQLGLTYGHEGFKMVENEETGYISTIRGATECVYDIAEIQTLAHMHYDIGVVKLMANIGPYAGWRLAIERSGGFVSDEIIHTFLDTDRRFEFGAKAGAGIALAFDPIEFHLNAKVRYSWSNLTDPDYLSPYYYSFAYPLDVMVTAGVHFHISRKTGKTKAMLRREAKSIVYGEEKQ